MRLTSRPSGPPEESCACKVVVAEIRVKIIAIAVWRVVGLIVGTPVSSRDEDFEDGFSQTPLQGAYQPGANSDVALRQASWRVGSFGHYQWIGELGIRGPEPIPRGEDSISPGPKDRNGGNPRAKLDELENIGCFRAIA